MSKESFSSWNGLVLYMSRFSNPGFSESAIEPYRQRHGWRKSQKKIRIERRRRGK